MILLDSPLANLYIDSQLKKYINLLVITDLYNIFKRYTNNEFIDVLWNHSQISTNILYRTPKIRMNLTAYFGLVLFVVIEDEDNTESLNTTIRYSTFNYKSTIKFFESDVKCFFGK